MAQQDPFPIILFDGVCGLCRRAVRIVLRRDSSKTFRFAAMQSAAGRELLTAHGLPEHGASYLVLIEDDRVYTKSDAVLRIAARLGFPWCAWAAIARCVPRFLRDFKYSLVARWRYRLFGCSSECMVPPPDAADRFL